MIEVMIALAMVSGLALVIMQMSKNSSTVQTNMQGSIDHSELRVELERLLASSKDCTASLENTTFQGSTIRTTPVPVELWLADQAGVRSRKIYSSTDLAHKTIGKLTIDNLEFTMPDYTAGTNFPFGPGSSKALLQVKGSKKSMENVRDFPFINKTLTLSFTTDAAGLSTITSCVLQAASVAIAKQGFCTPALTPDNLNVGVCPAIPGYTTNRITACIPGVRRTLTCCYVPANADSNGWCSDPMEGWSGCFNSCGAGSSDYFVQHLNGVKSGSNDTHQCCFIPKNSSVTKPFSSSAHTSWDSFSGCNPLAGYNVLRTIAVTGGVGNQQACTYVPQ
jgi:hypothetical protein